MRFLNQWVLCLFGLLGTVCPVRAAGVDGCWLFQERGFLLEIKGGKVAMFENAPSACVAASQGKVQGDQLSINLGPLGEFTGTVSVKAGILRLQVDETHVYEATCVPGLPADWQAHRVEKTKAALVNFDVLWTTFGERYAFFRERGLDWSAAREQYRPLAAAAKGDDALFKVFADLLRPLGDGHVTLFGGSRSRVFEGGGSVAWLPEAQRFVTTIKQAYLAGEPERRASKKLIFGRLKGGLGYINVLGMEGFAETGAGEAAALESALDDALTQLKDVPAMVLDLRFNGGGLDAHGLRIAARFAKGGQLAYTRRARIGDSWSSEESFFIPVNDRPHWNKPVFVLVSRHTASAAETCVLALRTNPLVSLVGERTQGIFSDMHQRTLPNGWVFTLSDQVYRDARGQCHEGAGLEPDVVAPMDLAAARQGRDPCLDAVSKAAAGR